MTPSTALLVGREGLDLPRFRELKGREARHTHSLIKEKLAKYEDSLALQINGREIASSLTVCPYKLRGPVKQTTGHKLFLDDAVESVLPKEKIEQKQTSLHKITEPAEGLKEKENENAAENNNVLPEISHK